MRSLKSCRERAATWASLQTGDTMIAVNPCIDITRVFVIVESNHSDDGHLALELIDGSLSHIRDDDNEIEGWEVLRA